MFAQSGITDPSAGYSTLPGFGELRKKAIDRFAERGFPTGREELWRFTDVAPAAV